MGDICDRGVCMTARHIRSQNSGLGPQSAGLDAEMCLLKYTMV